MEDGEKQLEVCNQIRKMENRRRRLGAFMNATEKPLLPTGASRGT